MFLIFSYVEGLPLFVLDVVAILLLNDLAIYYQGLILLPGRRMILFFLLPKYWSLIRNAIFHIEFCRVSLIPEPAQATTSRNISPTHILISTVYSIGLRILRFNRSSAYFTIQMTAL